MVEYLIGLFSLFICVSLLLLGHLQVVSEKRLTYYLFIFCLGSIVVSSNFKYSRNRLNYVGEFQPVESTLNLIMRNPETSISNMGDDSFYRVSNSSSDAVNHGMVIGFNSLSSFFSVTQTYIYQYLLDSEVASLDTPFRYYGLDQRNALESLACVKYFASQKGTNDSLTPTGYIQTAEYYNEYSKKDDVIYINPNALPIGYTYSNIENYDFYQSLNPVQKEQLMLQALILDETEGKGKEYEFKGEKIDYKITQNKNIKWLKDSSLEILKNGSELKLEFTPIEGNNTYVRFKGLDINGNSHSSVVISCSLNGTTKKIFPKGVSYPSYVDRENYLLNFGVSDSSIQHCTITFPKKALYKLEDIEIYSVPTYYYSQYIKKLDEESLENIKIGTNTIDGTVTVQSGRFMCFSIPYSTGWRVYVDGKAKHLIRANIMYMAVPLEPGKHSIHLEYVTPGLPLGIITSLISCILMIILIFKKEKIMYKKDF